MRLVVALNPLAGSGAGARAVPGVLSGLETAGHFLDVVGLRGAARVPDELAAALVRNPDALVVVGGDGLVHTAINLLAGTDVPLGIIAVGTGNDIARSLGLPLRSPSAALTVLLSSLEGEARRMDLGLITSAGGPDIWFAAACSAGLDAVVSARANSWNRPRGRARYVLALLRELPFCRPLDYRMTVDGAPADVKAMLVCVSNLRSIGGGMLITPDAQPDDGRLNLLVVRPLPRLKLLALFPLLFSGRHVRRREVQIRTASSVELEVPEITLYADGEPVGTGPVRIEVVPGALKVLA